MLLQVTLLMHRILRWLLYFWKICAPLAVTKLSSNSKSSWNTLYFFFLYVVCPKGVMFVVAFLVILLSVLNTVTWSAVTLLCW